MKDPVTFAIDLTGIKPIDLAKQLELSRQYISRAQLGCHVNLNKRLLQWIQVSTSREFEGGLSRTQVRNWYETFKLHKRQETYDRIKPELLTYRLDFIPPMRLGLEIEEEVEKLLGEGLKSTLDYMGDDEPIMIHLNLESKSPVANFGVPDFRTKFINWRKSYWNSTYRFASDMCIHPASVDNFEEGKVRGIPGDLKLVLDWMEKYSSDNKAISD